MRRYAWVIAFSAAVLLLAALVKPLAQVSLLVEILAATEAAHIAAHLVLYGTLALLARRAGLSNGGAAAVTLIVAVLQELVQLLMARRDPGKPELFDLVVDSVAIAVALGGAAWWSKRQRI